MLTTGLNLCQGNGALAGLKATELTAGTEHVAATTATEIDIEMASTEDVLKAVNGGIGRAPVRTAWEGVECNQVDLATKATQQLDEPGRIFGPVIDVGKQDILEGQAFAIGKWIGPACGE